jgi:hypothetical protein
MKYEARERLEFLEVFKKIKNRPSLSTTIYKFYFLFYKMEKILFLNYY